MGELSEGQRLVPKAAEDISAGLSVRRMQPTSTAEPSDQHADPGLVLQQSNMASGTHDGVLNVSIKYYFESY